MTKKKVTAPLSYDPGKGRPKEYLAYLNWQEMQALQRLNGGNMERGPNGLPSFAITTGTTTGTTVSTGGGSTSGIGDREGGGSESGGSMGGTTSPGATASTTGTTTESQSPDTTAQQEAATKNAAEAARTSALTEDARKGGIGSINVGPMQTPVKIAGGQITGTIAGMSQPSMATPPVPSAKPSDLGRPNVSARIAEGIMGVANRLGIDPVDLGTAVSYETAGTFNPTKKGPTTKWGTHRGLIQFGEPQAEQYGVDWKNPIESQLGPGGAIESYLKDAGVKPGMGMMDVYSAINAGQTGLYNRSDTAAGGAPGTVAEKVQNQMAGHRQKAESLLSSYVATANQYPSGSSISIPDPAAAAAFGALKNLPGTLSSVRIPAIPEQPTLVKMLPDSAKIAYANKMAEDFSKKIPGAIASGLGALDEMVNKPVAVAGKKYQERLLDVDGTTVEVGPENFEMMDPADRARIDQYQQAQRYDPNSMGPLGASPDQVIADREDYKLMPEEQDFPKYVTPEQQEIIAEQEKKNRRGIDVIQRAPFTGGIAAIGEGIQKIFTGKDIADYGTDLKNKYLQSSPEEQAAMRAKYPDMRRFAVSIGQIQPNEGLKYASYSGGVPVQEPGGKGNQLDSYSSQASYGQPIGPTAALEESGRPQQYYLWDLGVGIPSPGDPDYNEYQKYRRNRGSSANV